MKLKKLTSKKGTLVDKYDVNKLKDTNICRNFKQKLHETMNSLNINQEETIDAKWKAVKDAIKTTSHSNRQTKQDKETVVQQLLQGSI